MKTVEQLLESVSETLSEALLTDYTDKHDVDLESVKQFNLDKMEASRRKAEEQRLEEKVIELQRASEIDDEVDIETKKAIDLGSQDSGQSEEKMVYSNNPDYDQKEESLRDVKETGALDDLKQTLGIENEEKEDLKTQSGTYETL